MHLVGSDKNRKLLLYLIFGAIYLIGLLVTVERLASQDASWSRLRRDLRFLRLVQSGARFASVVSGGETTKVLEARLDRRRFDCPNLSSAAAESDGRWAPVANTGHKFFLYSAYLDARSQRAVIRIIAVTKTKNSDKVKCLLFFPERNPVVASATVRIIRENWGLPYSASFVLCPLERDPERSAVPESVSVVRKESDCPSNRLRIQDTVPAKRPPSTGVRIAACVKPLYNSYDQVTRMAEFLELNLILGVDHFILYDSAVGGRVDCLLRKFVEEGIVRLMPWKLDLESQKEIRTEGIFASLNDCLYRSMSSYTHVAVLDVDEFIVPRTQSDLKALLPRLGAEEEAGSFSFRNAFFYLQWPDDPLAPPHDLHSLKKTRRTRDPHPHRIRSKYVVVPQRALELGNHFVWEFLDGYRTLAVPCDVALLHHYRTCEFGGDDCVRSASVEDRRLHEYRDRLVSSVNATMRWYAEESCGGSGSGDPVR